ncbi:MAG TPA: aminotransferase class V-fold PLP-dependent enzyme [Nitrospiraceae bacterium]
MSAIDRRDFLTRTSLLLGASVLSSPLSLLHTPASATTAPANLDTWESVRNQFPLSPELIHMAGFFLASHPVSVGEAIERHRQGLDKDPIGYWFDQEEKQEMVVLRAAAEYLEVDPEEIALTDSTTMGLGLLYGGLQLRANQEILTTVHDHYSTDISLRLRAERTGASIRQVPLYRSLQTVSKGELVDTLLKQVRPRTRIVAITWVHSSTGLKLPVHEIAMQLATINRHRAQHDRVILCVDGVHALGVEDFRLNELGCDFFVAGTHKWMFGPRGTGIIWGHKRAWPIAHATIPTFNTQAYDMWMKLTPAKELPKSIHMTPGGFHSFEHRWALDEAFRFHRSIGKARITERIHALNQQLKQGLTRMSRVTLHTPLSQELSAGIVCFEVTGLAPLQVVKQLRQQGVVASVTPYATQYVRLAPGLLNSNQEVETVLKIIEGLRT